MNLEIRPATLADLPSIERMCWRNGEAEMRARIETAGTCSIIGLDQGRVVAQLYIRRYEPGFRSPRGMLEGDFWAESKRCRARAHTFHRCGTVGLLACRSYPGA